MKKAKNGQIVIVKAMPYHRLAEGTRAEVVEEDYYGDGWVVCVRALESGECQAIRHEDYTIEAEKSGFSVGDVVFGASEHGYYSTDRHFKLTGVHTDTSFYYEAVNFDGEEDDFIFTCQIGGLVSEQETKGDDKMSKFKIGDTVEVVDRGSFHFLNVGDIGKVVEFSEQGNPRVESGLLLQYVADSDLKLVEEAHKQRFNVGDIVCGNNSVRYGITNTDMTKGEVVNVHPNGRIDIKVLEHDDGGYVGQLFDDLQPTYFDLVEVSAKFKVGDKVRITGNGDGESGVRHYHRIGSVGTVVDGDSSHYSSVPGFKASVVVNGEDQVISEHHLELVESESLEDLREQIVEFLSELSAEELLDIIEEARK